MPDTYEHLLGPVTNRAQDDRKIHEMYQELTNSTDFKTTEENLNPQSKTVLCKGSLIWNM